MPTFLSDPPPTLYLLLFVAVVIAGAVAFRRQDRPSFIALGIAALLLGGLYLIDRLVQSPREESVQRVNDVARALNDRNMDAMLAAVSESFDYRGKKKADLRSSPLWGLLKSFDARVAAWDFSRDDVKILGDSTIQIGFMAKGEASDARGGGQMMYYFQATLVRDPDGVYRIRTMRAFDPLKHDNEIPIPFF
jgi:hypothetical protein